jgi:hypothetical protein
MSQKPFKPLARGYIYGAVNDDEFPQGCILIKCSRISNDDVASCIDRMASAVANEQAPILEDLLNIIGGGTVET